MLICFSLKYQTVELERGQRDEIYLPAQILLRVGKTEQPILSIGFLPDLNELSSSLASLPLAVCQAGGKTLLL